MRNHGFLFTQQLIYHYGMEVILNISSFDQNTAHPGYRLADSLRIIGGKTLLELQIAILLERGASKIHVLAPEGNEEALDAYKSDKVELHFVPKNLGTAGGLGLFIGHEDPYFYVPGNLYPDVDIASMARFHEEKESILTVFAHPEPHPEEKDVLLIRGDGQIVVVMDKERAAQRDFFYHNIIPTELSVLSPEVMMTLDPDLAETDFYTELFLPTVPSDCAFAYRGYEYVRRIESEQDYYMLASDLENGVPLRRRKGVDKSVFFLDRDGTINVFGDFVVRPEMLTLTPESVEGLRKINESGHLAILVTNQPVIARGEASMEDMNNILAYLEMLLGKEGVYLDGIYFCPHLPTVHPGSNMLYTKTCDCRKPGIGMLLQAKERFGIDIPSSWFIGDTSQDMKTANNAGCHGAMLLCGDPNPRKKYGEAIADFEAGDLLEAVKRILR